MSNLLVLHLFADTGLARAEGPGASARMREFENQGLRTAGVATKSPPFPMLQAQDSAPDPVSSWPAIPTLGLPSVRSANWHFGRALQ